MARPVCNQGNTLTVTNTPNTIVNWQFSTTQQNHPLSAPNASSAVVNRVVVFGPVFDSGHAESNGRVTSINCGIVFGWGSDRRAGTSRST
jgi:hypothetical protein